MVAVVIKLVEIGAICGRRISRSRRTGARRGCSIGGGGSRVRGTWNHKPRGGSSSMHLSNWGNMLRMCMCMVGVLKVVLLVNLVCLMCVWVVMGLRVRMVLVLLGMVLVLWGKLVLVVAHMGHVIHHCWVNRNIHVCYPQSRTRHGHL